MTEATKDPETFTPATRAELIALAEGPIAETVEIQIGDLVELCRASARKRLYSATAEALANHPPGRMQPIGRLTLRDLLGLTGIP